jgi:hypothetical protein
MLPVIGMAVTAGLFVLFAGWYYVENYIGTAVLGQTSSNLANPNKGGDSYGSGGAGGRGSALGGGGGGEAAPGGAGGIGGGGKGAPGGPGGPGAIIWPSAIDVRAKQYAAFFGTRSSAAGTKPGPESRTSADTRPGSLRVLMNNSRSSLPTLRIASMAL